MTLRKTGRLNDRKPDPGTDRSESVRDFQNFVGPGPRPIGFGPWIPVFAVIIFDQRLNLWGGTIDWISVCDESIVGIDPFWVKEFQFIAIFGFSERILWMGNPYLQIMENSSRNFSEIFIFWVVTKAVLLENSSIRFCLTKTIYDMWHLVWISFPVKRTCSRAGF